MSKLTKFVNNPELFLSDMLKKRKKQIRQAAQRYLPISLNEKTPDDDLNHLNYRMVSAPKRQPLYCLTSEQIQMLEIKKVYVTSDILMTKEKEQFSNLKWFFDLLSPVIQQATSVRPVRMSSSLNQQDRFSRIEFFSRSGIRLDINQTQFYFDAKQIKNESLEYLKQFFDATTLVVGYEMSEQSRYILTKINVAYIDVWLHPIRFLDDVLFGFSSNHQGIFNRLKEFKLDEKLYPLYATRLKVQSYKGYRRVEYKIEPDSAVFIGQTLEDKAICENGKMLTVLDFKSQIEDAGKKYKKLYYSRHPYVKSGDEDILNYLKSKSFVEVVDWPVYAMLSHDHVKYVFSISSSVVFEARAFGKKAEFLYQPVIELSDKFHQRSYITVYQEFVSPHFWSHVLADVMQVNQTPRLMYLEGKDKLRDMLAFYWSYRHIDKLEGMRYQLNAVDNALQKVRKLIGDVVTPSPMQGSPDLSMGVVLDALRDRLPAPLRALTSRYLGAESVDTQPIQPSHMPILATAIRKDAQVEFEKIIAHMQAADVVSFDVFDTLLVRPFAKPDDLFIFMQPMVDQITDQLPDFRSIRLAARKLVTADQVVGEEVPLKARYMAIGTQYALNDAQVNALYQLELELELTLIRPRHYAKKIFDEARRLGKKVIIVSDTFFPQEFVETLLSKNGFVDYDNLYASSSTGLLKATGHIYPFLIEQLAINPDKILHIGDNYVVDVVNSKKHGFTALHLPATVDVFEKNTGLSSVIKHHHPVARSLHVGLLANRLADDPLSINTPSYVNGDLESFGYAIYGPMLYAFASWLLEKSKQDQIQQLFFLARDGDIIKRAYDLVAQFDQDAPASHYVYASRRGVNVPSLVKPSDILELLQVNFSPMPLCALLEQRFGITVDHLSEQVFQKYGWADSQQIVHYTQDQERLGGLLLELSDQILDNAQQEREVLLAYFDAHGLKNNDQNKAIVDIGHNGTMQRSISKLIDHQKIAGYYFVTHEKIKALIDEGFHARGFAGEQLDPKDKTHPCMKHVLMYELLFLNEQGSFVKMQQQDGEYQPILLSVLGEESRIEMTRQVHRGALQFIQDIAIVTKSDDFGFSVDGVLKPYSVFLNHPRVVDVEMFNSVVFENFYSGRSYQYIVSQHDPKKSVWQEGSDLLKSSV